MALPSGRFSDDGQIDLLTKPTFIGGKEFDQWLIFSRHICVSGENSRTDGVVLGSKPQTVLVVSSIFDL